MPARRLSAIGVRDGDGVSDHDSASGDDIVSATYVPGDDPDSAKPKEDEAEDAALPAAAWWLFCSSMADSSGVGLESDLEDDAGEEDTEDMAA